MADSSPPFETCESQPSLRENSSCRSEGATLKLGERVQTNIEHRHGHEHSWTKKMSLMMRVSAQRHSFFLNLTFPSLRCVLQQTLLQASLAFRSFQIAQKDRYRSSNSMIPDVKTNRGNGTTTLVESVSC